MERFDGFSIPTYTQTPNEFFDIVMSGELTKSEIRILAYMIRYTFGWQRAGFSLQFTFTDIQKEMNMGRKQVNEGLKGCLEKGFLERAEIHGNFVYRLKLKSDEELPWDLKFDWKRVSAKREEFESGFERKPRAVSKGNQERFRKETKSGFERKPVEGPQTLDICEENDALKTTYKDNVKNNIKNNNTVVKPFHQDSETISPPLEDPVVVELSKHGLKVNDKELRHWRSLEKDEVILQVISEVVNRNDVKNHIGYIKRILEAGYTPTKNKNTNQLPDWISKQEESKETSINELTPEQKREAERLLRLLGEKV